LNNDNQQHLNTGDQPLAEKSDERRAPPPSQSPYKQLKEVLQALAATGLPYESVIRHPDGRIEITNKHPLSSETESDSYAKSAALLDKAFE